MADGEQLLKHPAVTVAAGAAATAVAGVGQLYLASERLPVVGSWLRRGRTDLSRRGELVIDQSIEPVKAIIAAVAAQVVELVLDEIDLNDLIRERIDLIGLADEVIDGVDLQAIIRQSTATVTENVMSDVRSQGERADDMVSGFVDRLLGRAREEQDGMRQPTQT
ncbi:hypothetical protein [Mycolicibacterium stellerae]|uniref:hypothetical protein n=1 Tax=Mycolicibacterium stellerae TaxID=2358193 RepID=UPI001F1D3890|nr:hypothetical protein [Mycolicibacterium stellerae]